MISNTQQGFTLFIAVLIGSLMLAIGFSIFNLSFKELLLSASSRDSQAAFYAADTGLECALYYDQKQNAFQATGPNNSVSISCGGDTRSTVRVVNSGVASWSWRLNTQNTCVDVVVQKFTSGTIRTEIDAFGYNTCDAENDRRTERGLQVRYSGL